MIDRIFKYICLTAAATGLVVAVAVMAELGIASSPIWKAEGLKWIFSADWNPMSGSFGVAGAIVGTLATTALALTLAIPLAFASALYLTSAPPVVAKPLTHALDLLAAIPSVIYGMWGSFVLCPLLQSGLAKVGIETNGFGLLTSGLVLALMVLPYISAVMRDVLAQAAVSLRESAMGAGCTPWEATWHIVVRAQRRGLIGGILIGLGRALGETMAVLFVCGGLPEIPTSLTDCCTTIAATLANDFAEADGLHRSALFGLGFVLLVVEFVIQMVAHRVLIVKEKA